MSRPGKIGQSITDDAPISISLPKQISESTFNDVFAGKRVHIIDSLAWSPHMETSLEIAIRCKRLGCEVDYSNLRSRIPLAEDHRTTWLPQQWDVNGIRQLNAERLARKLYINLPTCFQKKSLIKNLQKQAEWLLNSCETIEAIRGISLPEFEDIGWAVLSSAISMTRNSRVNLQSHYGLILRLLNSALVTHSLTQQLICQNRPELVVIFNGRFATSRAIKRAVEHQNIPVLIHERGSTLEKFQIASDTLHDPDYTQERIQNYWTADAEKSGRAFFERRKSKTQLDGFVFTKRQRTQHLGNHVSQCNDHLVVYFSSSDDEFASIGDIYRNSNFPTQLDALKTLYEEVEKIPNLRLCIRVHPNVAFASEEEKRVWDQLKFPQAIILGPNDPADSYALLDRATVVCTYGSTIGVEACYWRKPSLLLGRSLYDKLDVATTGGNATDIRNFLLKPTLKPQINAIKYGAFQGGHGIPFRHFSPSGTFGGRILGRHLTPPFTGHRKLSLTGQS